MPIRLAAYGIAYFPIRKVACTSLKLALFRLQYGVDFADHWVSRLMTIHQRYPTRRTSGPKGRIWSFTVIREPVGRMLSAYRSKVVRESVLGEVPGPSEFFAALAHYRAENRVIRQHTDPARLYVGCDLRRFGAVYRLREMDRLTADLAERTGRRFEIERLNPTHGGPRWADLSAAARKTLLAHTADDYALMSSYFTPPRA